VSLPPPPLGQIGNLYRAAALLFRYYAEMAPSWTSTSEKPIRSIFCEFVINRIIRVYVLDLFREFIVKAISRAALDNFFRVQRFWNVRGVSFVENFTHVNPIVLTPAPPPLNCIASRFVPSRQFH